MARILHIEDDPGNRLLVRKLLQSAGHTVTDAPTASKGFNWHVPSDPISCSST
jgi:CheY-like chemotaxis protein